MGKLFFTGPVLLSKKEREELDKQLRHIERQSPTIEAIFKELQDKNIALLKEIHRMKGDGDE